MQDTRMQDSSNKISRIRAAFHNNSRIIAGAKMQNLQQISAIIYRKRIFDKDNRNNQCPRILNKGISEKLGRNEKKKDFSLCLLSQNYIICIIHSKSQSSPHIFIYSSKLLYISFVSNYFYAMIH